MPDVPNFEPNDVRPKISNFPLPNLNQQDVEPPNVPNKEEEVPILEQIDSILGEQVKIKKPKTEIDPTLGKCFDKTPEIFDDNFTEKNENQRELSV